jgi:hypothetical protein
LPESIVRPPIEGVGSSNGGTKFMRLISTGSLPTSRASASIACSIA